MTLLLVERVVAVLVERRQGADHRRQHRHRVRVAREALEEALDVLVQQGAVDLVLEGGELVHVRQLTVDQQRGHLKEGGALGQLLDRVAAVPEDALLAVEVGESRFYAAVLPYPLSSVTSPVWARSFPDVEALVADGAVDHRVGVLAIAVPQYYRVVAHVIPHRRCASSSRCPDCLYHAHLALESALGVDHWAYRPHQCRQPAHPAPFAQVPEVLCDLCDSFDRSFFVMPGAGAGVPSRGAPPRTRDASFSAAGQVVRR